MTATPSFTVRHRDLISYVYDGDPKGGVRVADVHQYGGSATTRELRIARANLIAAGPELLEALKEATEHYIGRMHAASRDGHCDTAEEAVNVKRWRAAIARAEGRV